MMFVPCRCRCIPGVVITLAVVAGLSAALAACRPATRMDSSEVLWSANATADNVALLLSVNPWAADYGALLDSHMARMRSVLGDPKGDYGFLTLTGQRTGHLGMLDMVQSAAARVNPDGTMYVFIGAHGGPDGRIQTDENDGVAVGYPEIIQALKEGRQGKAGLRRLVLYVSACYSARWMDVLENPDAAMKERLVLTSTGPFELSQIDRSMSAMVDSFIDSGEDTAINLSDFLAKVTTADPSMRYTADPVGILDEPLVNPVSPISLQ